MEKRCRRVVDPIGLVLSVERALRHLPIDLKGAVVSLKSQPELEEINNDGILNPNEEAAAGGARVRKSPPKPSFSLGAPSDNSEQMMMKSLLRRSPANFPEKPFSLHNYNAYIKKLHSNEFSRLTIDEEEGRWHCCDLCNTQGRGKTGVCDSTGKFKFG
nr:hypothetical protein Iba_chr01bCG0050 [Ipomoea batatas]GMC55575.1 hypothetical protein Iba_chr01eCG8730 [Ipomoea batatas]